MFHSWKIGTAFGIGIHVHWSFLILPAWVLLQELGLGGWAWALFAVALVLAVFGCVVLHELGHALAARRFGIRTRDITLYPIGGVARLERMSEKPWEELWIAVAGPAVNVVIAGGLWVLLGLIAATGPLFAVPLAGLDFLYMLMIINLVLVGFNMLPAFPMDGGRVLRALLAMRLGHVRATEVAVQVGTLMAVLMAVVGAVALHSLSWVLVAGVVWLLGQQELAGLYRRARREEPHQFGNAPDDAFEQAAPPAPGSLRVFLWDPQTQTWVSQRPMHSSRS
jgi:Zn-dependent protease